MRKKVTGIPSQVIENVKRSIKQEINGKVNWLIGSLSRHNINASVSNISGLLSFDLKFPNVDLIRTYSDDLDPIQYRLYVPYAIYITDSDFVFSVETV
jgi:hypothetical protein